MGLYLRGKIYWFTIKEKGKRIQESTGTGNKKLAVKIYSKAITQVQEGNWFEGVKAKSVTVGQLLEKHQKDRMRSKSEGTLFRDVTLLMHLNEYFGDHTLAEVTPDLCNEYRQKRYEQGRAIATVNRELGLLRNAFNSAIRVYKWCRFNPVSEIKLDKENNTIDRWLTFEEERCLMESLEGRYRDIVILALNTGLRQMELLSLKWPQIDLFRKTLMVIISKNGDRRTIPLNRTALELLMSKNKVRHISNFVFPSHAGTMIDKAKLKVAFGKALRKAGIEKFRFHDLRHTFATRLAQAGVDLYKISKLLGHRDISTTQRYAHHYPESLRSSVEILDRATNMLQSGILAEGVSGVST